MTAKIRHATKRGVATGATSDGHGESDSTSASGPSFLAGGGELGELIRSHDWASTPLGPPEQWPKSLRTCVRIVLTSQQPMFVWWGPKLINIYNDAYRAIVGGKHPRALGQPASVVWREIWNEIEPRAESAMRDNVGTYDEALLLIMERYGYPEETYYTFSYSPVPNDDDTVGGLICANTDDTQRIIGERQLALLRDLATETRLARTAHAACEGSATAFARASRDLPFLAIYLLDSANTEAVLAAHSGFGDAHVPPPERLRLDDARLGPALEVIREQHVRVIDMPRSLFASLPSGAWREPPVRMALAPITASGRTGQGGLLLIGLNPFRLFDDGYHRFLTLLSGQVAASIGSAEAYDQERKRAEALAELDRAKTAFFSNVSHEFRTPLTLMLGPLEDAMRSEARSLSDQNLETTHRNALRLLKLVNTLLDFSRIEAGRAQASFEPTDLATLTRDLASAFRSAIERGGLEFEVACEALAETVYVDRDMWEKIVLNLLSNALKYTFNGAIGLSLRARDGMVELAVSDSGTGIPAHELPHLFERFHRVQGARARTHEGSGIGLALVHELVRLHGGRIAVESEPDVGSTFTVSVPLGHGHLPSDRLGEPRAGQARSEGVTPYVVEANRWLPDADEDQDLEPTSRLKTLPPALSAAPEASVRILVADDNADMREYIVRLLSERWQVIAVGDGERALRALRSERFDLVLTDVMMPRLDGFGLLRELRADERTRGLPVIMLSARAGEESRLDGLEAGADDYLVKPFSARELLARVATHLQLSRLRTAALRERARLHDIFDQAPLPVAVLSGAELRFEVANPSFREMVARDDLLGRTVGEAFPEVSTHAAIDGIFRAVSSGEVLRIDEQSVPLMRGGAIREGYFSYIVQPIYGSQGHEDGVIIVATEVTNEVLARRRVEGLRAAAEHANRAKDEFLSTLSHELRTPLNAIVGWSTLLRTGAVPELQRARALETVERNARLQARLIDDLLDLSRIEQGKLVLSVGPLEMVRVVEAAIEAVRPAAEAKQIRLQPVLDSHATIVGDADRLQQVIWNLLSNAIKFTAKSGRVQVRLRREQSFVEVVVADNGVGMDASLLPHVFDRFRQGDPSFTRRTGGLGLGLAIARSLVELHGGEISAHSDGEGQGATFVVRLPTAPLRADSRTREESNMQLPAAPSFECPAALKDLRVLVVDDEPETRELVKFVVEQCEAHVATAADAPEAFAAAVAGEFDLLISDVGMPGEDGYSLIRKLRARGGALARIPALALTAYARSEDRTQALRSGFDMHLAKPIDPSELLVVLETLVRGASNKA